MGGISLATGFDWIGTDCFESDPCDWQAVANWDPDSFACDPCYPSTSDDDATIPVSEDTTVVDLGNQDFTIDDMSVSTDEGRTLRFVGSAKLTVESLVISGPTTGAIEVIVQFWASSQLEVKDPP